MATASGAANALPTVAGVAKARQGSRAARLSQPRTIDVLTDMAAKYDVCTRPQPFRMLNPGTLRTQVIDLRCGATLTAKCPACAARAKKLRQVQCREGWHRTDEPITPQPSTQEHRALVERRALLEFAADHAGRLADWEQAEQLQVEIDQLERQIPASGLRGLPGPSTQCAGTRRVRSTRRRQDAPNLPRKKVTARTIGRAYIGRDGTEHRPSTALTLTLGSYGRVRRSDSTPVDFETYNYRRAALDAVHFPALLDRFWQNLRRCLGWRVQYFGCVEPQRRLAPHAHYAVRGSFPRLVFRQVVAATYHQVWQPATDLVIFGEDGPQPEWLEQPDGRTGYLNPWTGRFLPTWDEAEAEHNAQVQAGEVGPVHVMRFGEQMFEDVFDDRLHQGASSASDDGGLDEEYGERPSGMQGMESGTTKAERFVRYLTKYITKSVDECHTRTTAREIEHHHRFYEALRFEPCSERCANWLRYGIQPKHARPGLVIGRCRGRVHQPSTLGIKGRRILVSRDWSGKTLADHRADQTAWVRQVLALGLGHTTPAGVDDQGDQLEPAQESGDGPEPVRWERAHPHDRDVKPLHQRLWRNLGERIRRRTEWQIALARITANNTGPPELATVSATATAGGGEGV